jgi:hypothetical protein
LTACFLTIANYDLLVEISPANVLDHFGAAMGRQQIRNAAAVEALFVGGLALPSRPAETVEVRRERISASSATPTRL